MYAFEDYHIYILTIVTIALSFIYALIYFRTKSRTKNILLLGLSGSGKTSIYSRLFHKKDSLTFASMKENSFKYINVNNHLLNIVDIPGHESITYHILAKFRLQVDGIIFVIDSKNFPNNYKDVANYLYNLLNDCQLSSKNIPILIICNKQDLPLAKNASLIKGLIEKEFELLKSTKSTLPDIKNNIKHATANKCFQNLNRIVYIEAQQNNLGKEDIISWINKF